MTLRTATRLLDIIDPLPIYFYSAAGGACSRGMVGSINAPTLFVSSTLKPKSNADIVKSGQTFDAYQDRAVLGVQVSLQAADP